MKKIGITGGIGSGKSTVAKLIMALGYPVYIADDEAKRLINTDEKIRQQIIELLGDEAYDAFGYNRRYVADRVFTDRSLLQQLNQIVHPAVSRHFKEWCLQFKDDALLFQEAAILFENGSYKKFDKTILVKAPTDVRLRRVMKRDALSKEEVMRRMDKQWTDQKKSKLADYVVMCDGENIVIHQVLKIIKEIEWDY